MSSYEIWSLIIQSLTALSLLSIVLVTIFGSHIKHILNPARVEVDILDKNGELTVLDNGHKVVYYHLRIINRGRIVIKNCRLILKQIHQLQNGEFKSIPISVPPRYFWSPSETSPEDVDIISDRIADFGYIIDSSKEFKPTVTPILNSFRGNLKHNETFRYFIEIVADNLRPKQLTGIEITWDGIWPGNLNEMHRHLIIQKI